MINKLRKVFDYNNSKQSCVVESSKMNTYENNISACGCLIYKLNNKKLELLLIKYDDPKWNRLDDLGGQIDIEDETVYNAIKREVSEETNNLINLDELVDLYPGRYFYNKKSKYYFATIKVDDKFQQNTEIYGDLEITDNIKRKIDWYDYKLCKTKLSYRLLLCDELITYFDSLIR